MKAHLPRLLPVLLALAAVSAAAADPLTVTIVKITEDVSVREGNGEWQDAHEGQLVRAGQEIHTGPGSSAGLAFSDGTAVVIKELTQLKVATLFGRTDRVKVELLLKIGELKAQVHHEEAVATDFRVRTPTATASVRGTEIERISYYPPKGTETGLISGHLLVVSRRGLSETGAGDHAQVRPDGEVLAPDELLQDSARVHVEPNGLTASEVSQLNTANQPVAAPPTGGDGSAAQTHTAGGGTLVFRVVRQ